jgi:drug/metabolite transporter (DMT)-like permease
LAGLGGGVSLAAHSVIGRRRMFFDIPGVYLVFAGALILIIAFACFLIWKINGK